jgi:hypothetical protein
MKDFGNHEHRDNAAVDVHFLRSNTHPEVRVELCRALLEEKLFTLIPQGPVDGADEGELVEVEAAGDTRFKLWSRDGRGAFLSVRRRRWRGGSAAGWRGTSSQVT